MATDRESPVVRSLLGDLLAARSFDGPSQRLDRQGWFAVGATYFLLAETRPVSVERFVTYTLGRLMQQLSRETERRYVAYAGQVHGRIDWPHTIKAQHTESADPTRFVCREVHRRYDTPENQLLKYVVEGIHACLLSIPAVMRGGTCYYLSDGEGVPLAAAIPTAIRLGRIETALNHARYHVRYREITQPYDITGEHLRHVEISRQQEYADVVQLYHRYQGMTTAPARWLSQSGPDGHVLPLPARADDRDGRWWVSLGAAVIAHRLSAE
jgi:hypothetical protein